MIKRPSIPVANLATHNLLSATCGNFLPGLTKCVSCELIAPVPAVNIHRNFEGDQDFEHTAQKPIMVGLSSPPPFCS